MRIIKSFIYITSVILFLNNCEGSLEPTSEEDKYFTLTYRLEGVLNENHEIVDSTILGVGMQTATYFSKENYTSLTEIAFQKRDYAKGFYFKVDSVYTGCQYQMAALFCKVKPIDDNPYRKNWRVYVTKWDTIKSAADSVVVFRWPEDTLTAFAKYWLLGD